QLLRHPSVLWSQCRNQDSKSFLLSLQRLNVLAFLLLQTSSGGEHPGISWMIRSQSRDRSLFSFTQQVPCLVEFPLVSKNNCFISHACQRGYFEKFETFRLIQFLGGLIRQA